MRHDLLRAAEKKDVERTPVWFMRQAGRYLPGYRKIRQTHSLTELIANPTLAAQVAIEPVNKLGVDAAIVFSDILILFGNAFTMTDGGPRVKQETIEPKDVRNLMLPDPSELKFVYDQIRILRSKLEVPVIGFTGGPFTLASYLIEGGQSRSFEKTKEFMFRNPTAWGLLLDKISEAAAGHLERQVASGAQVIQLFDSWIGALSPADFREFAFDQTDYLLSKISVPKIYFGTMNAGLLPEISRLRADVIGVDWRVEIKKAWEMVGARFGMQGNLDPSALIGGPALALKRARHILDAVSSKRGYIFNLGHGVLPSTQPELVKKIVDLVHSYPS